MTNPNFPNAARDGRLPVVALALAVLVGPVGAGLGAWLAVRARRAGQRVSLLVGAAIAVGIIWTVAAAVLISSLASAVPTPAPNSTPTPSRTYPTWASPSQPTIVVASPVRPLPTSLPSYVPATVGPYKAAEAAPDQGTVDKGATSANTASYSTAKKSVHVVTAEWPSAEAAEAYVKAQAAAQFGAGPARVTAPIPSGAMWYYAVDGQGTLYSFQGRFTMIVTGEPGAVQEFFRQFPA